MNRFINDTIINYMIIIESTRQCTTSGHAITNNYRGIYRIMNYTLILIRGTNCTERAFIASGGDSSWRLTDHSTEVTVAGRKDGGGSEAGGKAEPDPFQIASSGAEGRLRGGPSKPPLPTSVARGGRLGGGGGGGGRNSEALRGSLRPASAPALHAEGRGDGLEHYAPTEGARSEGGLPMEEGSPVGRGAQANWRGAPSLPGGRVRGDATTAVPEAASAPSPAPMAPAEEEAALYRDINKQQEEADR
ncbi:hypothetical protein T492DRAFT_838426 [Pavlovales sp. CCMP2436]|nr:hypothetical protein T492DRAFT_838426 [Pavlovales sp. CCMP2436]